MSRLFWDLFSRLPPLGDLGDVVTPAIAQRYASVLRLRDGATTPGERAAAEAAQARMEERYPALVARPPREAPRAAPRARPAPPPPPRGARPLPPLFRAEFREGASSKFWQYRAIPGTAEATVNWGRIGTDGQEQIVEIAVAQKRWREKLAKGYVQVSP